MKFKGLLLDIDNTLYNYEQTHKIAHNSLITKIAELLDIDRETVISLYSKARKQIHTELHGTAASHNRLLYLQRLFELANANPLSHALPLYNHYWDTFVEEIKVYEGVYEFLDSCRDKKICLLTDLTADIQHKKVLAMKLFDYLDMIVTSEEAGIEKPHPYMFMLALNKMNLAPNEVCMIGDTFDKDILGASHLNIKSFWINQKCENKTYDENLVREFQTFDELAGYINE